MFCTAAGDVRVALFKAISACTGVGTIKFLKALRVLTYNPTHWSLLIPPLRI